MPASTSYTHIGITAANSTNFTAINNIIRGNSVNTNYGMDDGIIVENSNQTNLTASQWPTFNISNNTISGAYDLGIELEGFFSRSTIAGNIINTPGGPFMRGIGGYYNIGVDNIRIQNNVFNLPGMGIMFSYWTAGGTSADMFEFTNMTITGNVFLHPGLGFSLGPPGAGPAMQVGTVMAAQSNVGSNSMGNNDFLGGAIDFGAFASSYADLGDNKCGASNPGDNPQPLPIACGAGNLVGAATFLKYDTKTQGNWGGVYGADGYYIPDGAELFPSYVSASFTGYTLSEWDPGTWIAALQVNPLSRTPRIASCMQSNGPISINLDFTDKMTHQVAIYLEDWGLPGGGRSERVDVLDANGNWLDTRQISAFHNGEYLVWNLSGNVTIKVTSTDPNATAEVTGIFFR